MLGHSLDDCPLVQPVTYKNALWIKAVRILSDQPTLNSQQPREIALSSSRSAMNRLFMGFICSIYELGGGQAEEN